MNLRIGTRGSRLALAQSEWVKIKIKEQYPEIQVELVPIKTKGDRILDSSLSRIGGKGLFVTGKNRSSNSGNSCKFFPYSLINQYVGIYGHSNSKDDTGDTC